MCGIVGVLALGKLGKKEEEKRQKFMRFASTELLLRTEERGKDATGAAILFADGNYMGIKRGEESAKWLAKFGSTEKLYGSLLKVWEEYEHPVKVYLGHCRKGTIGDKEDNENNHPIKIGNIIGIHNGVIKNDDIIQKHLGCKRDGKVDSEMIFRLMSHFTNEGKEPWTLDMLEQIIARLTGAWAAMAFNADNMYQVPIFRDGRPVELILIKELAVLIVVSDIKIWTSFHFQYERTIFYAKMKSLSSLLTMNIEKRTMPDDSAAIIDLDAKCNQETTIDDIWQWRKIPRNNKIWTSMDALNKSNPVGVIPYVGNQSMAKPEHKTIEADYTPVNTKETKDTKDSVNSSTGSRRVFNTITKKYDIERVTTPKTLKDDESITIPLTDSDEKKTKSKSTFETDQNGQETTDNKLDIEDYTEYDKENDASTSCGSEDTVNEKGDDVINAEAEEPISMTEVDMTVDNAELMALATKTYQSIAPGDRGYSDMDTLLNDIEIKDEPTANELGMKVVANRVAGVQWVRGFINGWWHRDRALDYSEEKTKKREKYIDNLKSLVIILGAYFARVKAVVPYCAHRGDEELHNIAVEHISKRPSFDIESINGIFNEHETGKIKIAREIISTVANRK